MAEQHTENTALKRTADDVLASRSWRYTKPLRWISGLISRRK